LRARAPLAGRKRYEKLNGARIAKGEELEGEKRKKRKRDNNNRNYRARSSARDVLRNAVVKGGDGDAGD